LRKEREGREVRSRHSSRLALPAAETEGRPRASPGAVFFGRLERDKPNCRVQKREQPRPAPALRKEAGGRVWASRYPGCGKSRLNRVSSRSSAGFRSGRGSLAGMAGQGTGPIGYSIPSLRPTVASPLVGWERGERPRWPVRSLAPASRLGPFPAGERTSRPPARPCAASLRSSPPILEAGSTCA